MEVIMQLFCQNVIKFHISLLQNLSCCILYILFWKWHSTLNICCLLVHDEPLLTDWAILLVAHLCGCCITNAILPFKFGLWIVAETAAFLNASATRNWTGIPRRPWPPVPINWKQNQKREYSCIFKLKGKMSLVLEIQVDLGGFFWKCFNNFCSQSPVMNAKILSCFSYKTILNGELTWAWAFLARHVFSCLSFTRFASHLRKWRIAQTDSSD